MSEMINDKTDLVTVTWHKETGWMIICPILGIKLDCLTLIELSIYLESINNFICRFGEGAE